MHSSAIYYWKYGKLFWSKNSKQNTENTFNYLSFYSLMLLLIFWKGACSFAQKKSTLLIAGFEAL